MSDPLCVELRLPWSDALAEQLWEELGATSVAQADSELIAQFSSQDLAAAAAAVVGGCIVEVCDDSYLDVWRTWAQPTVVGRLTVRPAWLAPLGGTELEIAIDPAHVFGHGGHPSTRLVLHALAQRLTPEDRVADVGCGSGVLSVAAVALGASHVDAVDIDPEAIAAATENAERNAMADRIHNSTSAALAMVGPYDVVVANIGVVVLRDLAPHLCGLVAPGGWLIFSGLLRCQWEEIVALCSGLRLVEVNYEGDWAAPVLVAEPTSSRHENC